MERFTKHYWLFVISSSFIASTVFALPLSVIAADDTQIPERRTIRVTTGIEEVQGWEQGLVRGNPNLGRWHWDPIYSYKQGYAKVSPPAAKVNNIQNTPTVGGPSANNSVFKYPAPAQQDSRPKHIPFSFKALAEVQAKLSQPAKPQHENNVYGKLTNKQTQAKIVPYAPIGPVIPEVATYGKPYARQDKLDTAIKYSSEKASVRGQLLTQKQRDHIKQASRLKQKGTK